jgi:hypothetical protein
VSPRLGITGLTMRLPIRLFALIIAVTLAAMSPGHALEPPLPTRLGCFKDTSVLDLDGYLERSNENTPERCADICKKKGFRFAAVQNGESCLCGNSYGKYGPADNCTMRCTGGLMTCGGSSANEVFEPLK